MEVKSNNSIKNNLTNTTTVQSKSKYMSSNELQEKYFKELKKDFKNLDLKKNKVNVFSENGVTITLSTDLLKKACKDPKIDKELRKSLKDASKYKNTMKSFNYSKDGHKIKSISFFIDGSRKISCSIRLGKDIELKDAAERKKISRLISSEYSFVEKKCDSESSLFYKYISLLNNSNNNNNYMSLDITV